MQTFYIIMVSLRIYESWSPQPLLIAKYKEFSTHLRGEQYFCTWREQRKGTPRRLSNLPRLCPVITASCILPVHTRTLQEFICLFDRHLLRIFCVPDNVLSSGYKKGNKMVMVTTSKDGLSRHINTHTYSTYMHIHTLRYIHTNIYTYAYIYIHTHIPTHTYTHSDVHLQK